MVSGNAIQSFGLTAGSDTTINDAGSGYTYGTVNLASGYTFSDAALTTASAVGGSGGAVTIQISPKEGHGNDAVGELAGHYVMTRALLTGAEGDDFLTGNDFRSIALVTDPTTYGTSTVASLSTYRQVYATKLTSVTGTFTPDEVITQATTAAIGKVVAVTLANANTITFTDGYANPELQPDSGNIIYQENRKPIGRATDQSEDIKIIVEF